MSEQNQSLVRMDNSPSMSLDLASRKDAINSLLNQVALVMEVMEKLMKEKEHYGKIPGCGDKPTLLQPGAEKLQFAFRLVPVFHETVKDFPGNHREYCFTCDIRTHGGNVLVEGYPGTATTLEGKWRFRTGPKKPTGKPVPKEYWTVRQFEPAKAQALLGGKGFVTTKDDSGQWIIAEQGEKVEHDNPADYWNTCRKMAAKRAFVGAIIKATGCSDLFTQDLEELEAQAAQGDSVSTKTTATAAPKQTAEQPSEPPTKRAASTADVTPKAATEQTRAWMLKELEPYGEDCVLAYARDKAILLPTEALTDWPLAQVPTSKEALRELQWNIEEWRTAQSGGPPAEDEAWREFEIPFGKSEGQKLGDVAKNTLFGFWANFTVETEYQGRPKKPETIERDQQFRDALDAAGRHYEFKKAD